MIRYELRAKGQKPIFSTSNFSKGAKSYGLFEIAQLSLVTGA